MSFERGKFMTKSEKLQIMMMAAEIKRLASLENASFCMDAENDKRIKEEIKPYMEWFKYVAFLMNDFAQVTDKIGRQETTDRIYRSCQNVEID